MTLNRDTLQRLASGLPQWRVDRMSSAFETFESLTEPTGAEEDWRYVDFDLKFDELGLPDERGDEMPPGPFRRAVTRHAGELTIVDGIPGDIDGVEGLEVTRLGESPLDDWPGRVRDDHNKVVAAAAAFGGDGLLVRVPSGKVIEDALVIDVQAVTDLSASFPTIRVEVGENAEANVLVMYRSPPGSRLLLAPTVELDIAPAGRLRFLSIQDVAQSAYCVVHQRARVGNDATARMGEVGLGGEVGRLDLGVDLAGNGATVEVVGLFFGEGTQTLDYRMLINHIGRNTTSDVFLKGAVEDDAESVFTGLLRIEKGAVRSSAFETNRNLVLSENAKAHSVPNLEILCDDVVCGHGSSVGPLDEDLLYYLMSRGLRRPRAERLLVKGFFREVIDRLPIKGVAEPVSTEVFTRFISAQEEGRIS